MKRKRGAEEPTFLSINNSMLSVDQDRFMALLANRASDGSLSCTYVTTEAMVLPELFGSSVICARRPYSHA